jgi:hypothetical protein
MGTVTEAPEQKKTTRARPGSSSPQQHRRRCASPSTLAEHIEPCIEKSTRSCVTGAAQQRAYDGGNSPQDQLLTEAALQQRPEMASFRGRSAVKRQQSRQMARPSHEFGLLKPKNCLWKAVP